MEEGVFQCFQGARTLRRSEKFLARRHRPAQTGLAAVASLSSDPLAHCPPQPLSADKQEGVAGLPGLPRRPTPLSLAPALAYSRLR